MTYTKTKKISLECYWRKFMEMHKLFWKSIQTIGIDDAENKQIRRKTIGTMTNSLL
jgi:hypothetical protein